MTHDEIRITKIEGLASLDELNTSLAEGFDILGDPLVVNDRLTFVLIRKGKPDKEQVPEYFGSSPSARLTSRK